MKILHLIDSGGVYGAEVMLLGLMAEQRSSGDEPLLASIGTPGQGAKPLELEARRRGLEVEAVRMWPGPNPAGALRIACLARRQGCALIHTHGYKANILMGLLPRALRGVPAVATLHGWTSTGGWNRMRLYAWANALSLRFLDRVIAVDGALAARAGLRGALVVPNGIGRPEDPRPAEPEADIASFCDRHTVLGTIGRLSPEKAQADLLEAFALLAPDFPDLRLLVLGDGPLREALERRAQGLGLGAKALFAGYRKDAQRYLGSLKGFVLPSLTEGLPMVLLEAMQAGVPIVATAVGGVPRLLESGEAGILVPPGQPHGLARGMRTLLEDPQLAERLAGRARDAVRGLGASEMACRYRLAYQEALAGGGLRGTLPTAAEPGAGPAGEDPRRPSPVGRAPLPLQGAAKGEGGGVRVECLTVSELPGIWDLCSDLARGMAYPSFFCQGGWLSACAENLSAGDSLLLLVVRQGSGVTAVLPLVGRRNCLGGRDLHFLGADFYPDPIGLICRQEDRAASAAALRRFLLEMPGWDRLVLDALLEDELACWQLPGRPVSLALFLTMQHGFDQLLHDFPKAKRNKINARSRKLLEAGGELVFASDRDSRRDFLEELWALHRKRALERNLKSTFAGPRVESLHRRLAETENVRLYGLRYQGRLIAVLYGFEFCDRFFFYQIAHDPECAVLSPGLVVLILVIKDCFARGIAEFNFLQGDQDYKRHWTDEGRVLYRAVLGRGSWRCRLFGAWDLARDLCRSATGWLKRGN